MCSFIGNTHKQRGSSLVNRIFVCVMVVVVGLVLFPVLNRPRESGGRPKCPYILKELANAVIVYANDYDGCLPSSARVNGSPKWNRRDFIKFATRTGKHVPGESRATYREVIYDYARSKDIFFCPTDPLKDEAREASTKASYYWKLAVDKAWYGEGCAKPYQKIEDYPYASDTIMLYERKGFHNGQRPLINGTSIYVAYLDTHVKGVTLKNATTGDPVNCAANDDGEPMYFNYNYKANKGLPNDKAAAKWVDPSKYGDRL